MVGYEGLYIVSNMGNVMGVPKSTQSGHLISQRENPKGKGYMSVCLCKDSIRKNYSVHRLVAKAFIPNYSRKPEVNHINGDRADNRVENLEWVTRSENEIHAYKTLGREPNKPWKGKPRLFARKLTNEQVMATRKDTRSSRQVGMEYDVSKSTIQAIRKGKIYKDVE